MPLMRSALNPYPAFSSLSVKCPPVVPTKTSTRLCCAGFRMKRGHGKTSSVSNGTSVRLKPLEECEEYNFALASAAGLGTEHKPLYQQEMWVSLERLRISVREEAEFAPLRESEAYRNSDTRHTRFACGIRSWPAHGINNAKHLQRQPCLLIPRSRS